MVHAYAARPLKVGLLWHSANSGNLGVGALTVSNLAIARQAAYDVGCSPEFLIIGMADRGPPYVSKDEASVMGVNTRTLLSPSGCWSALAEQDCVLDIGAGDSFTDIYGAKRFGFLWLTKMMTVARGRPLVLSPQTIGPFSRQPYLGLARAALERSEAVVARDEASFAFLEKLAPKARGIQSVDVAFALPFQDRSAERSANGKLRVGVNVSGLLFREAEAGTNRFGLQVDYAALMRRFIAVLEQRADVETHLITHANGDGADDDRTIADRLSAEFPMVVRAPDFVGPSEAKAYISSLDFLVAGRMHACIGAFSAGTPVTPIAYSRKFSGLFGTLGYPWMVPVTGMGTDQALAYLVECLDNRDQLAADERTGMLRVEGLLEAYRAELRRIFSKAARG